MFEALLVAGALSAPKNPTLELLEPKPIVETVQIEKVQKTYTVGVGDNLTKISKAHSVDLKRLWNANTQLTSPDLIEPGMVLKIPENDEVLPEREMPVTINVVSNHMVLAQSPQVSDGGFSSGNTYEPGQCVWYVKNLRPEIPNNWGNASSWLYNARNAGWPTGVVPKVNAVGVAGNHVVLITAVNSDGTVSYTDMNGRWVPFEIGYGTKPADYYRYIY